VTLEDFTRDRGDSWSELDLLVESAHRRPEKLGAARVRRLGTLYRSAAADLALARRRFPNDPVTLRLEQRVGRARQLVYDAPARRESVIAWLAHGYWQAVRALWVELAIAAVLMLGSAALAGVWADRDPGSAGGLVPGAYQAVTQPRPHGADLQLPASERTAFSTEIFTNNIRVTLLAFAAGLTAGIGTGLLLLFNGLQLGVVGGLAVGSGNGRIEPGVRTRAQAIGLEARNSIKVVLGTAPWLVIAGLIEGFLTPAGLGLPATIAIGFGVAAVYWALVVLLGRPPVRPEPATSP
jgi:uncharacterized membrane protein SpoIIM required for sporulation